MSSNQDISLLELETYVLQTLVSRSLRIATASLLVYDTIIMFDKEVKYFWSKPRNFVSILYFTNRYLGLYGALSKTYLDTFNASPKSCQFSAWSYNLANTIVTVIVDYILVMRVSALWGREKLLSTCLTMLILVESIVSLVCFVLAEYLSSISSLILTPSISVCIVSADAGQESRVRVLALIDWLVVIAVGLVLMTLAVYKAIQYWNSSPLFKGYALVQVLITDQLMWYFFIISCGILNIIVFNIRSSNSLNTVILDAIGNPSFLSLIGCHMLFNLKIAGERSVSAGTDYSLSTMSAVKFQEAGT